VGNIDQVTTRNIKKILFVGAGAVGGYFGGRLCKSGANVTFFVRQEAYDHISENGLTIKSIHGDFWVHPFLIHDISQISSVDLIVLAVKCYDLLPALKEIAPLVEKEAVILTLQNGVDTEEQVLSYFKRDCVVAGLAYITARMASPGVIEHHRRGMISLGELSGEKSDRATHIYDLFSKAGISCSLRNRILNAKWEKLCWNATFNPLSVILDGPISLVLDSPPLLEIVRLGISEVMDVASAEGITLDPSTISKTISASNQFRGYHTSMYEDYKNGKQTEIDFLNGDIIARGKKLNIPTPTHQMLHALVKGLVLNQSLKISDK
jgi:2-dehydropantoate 2-reductase